MFLETERLMLRPFSVADAPSLLELNADARVMLYAGDPPFSGLAQAEQFVREYDHYERFQCGRLAVLDKTSGAFLGWCGLKYHPKTEETDLGYRFLFRHWGQGYATEAARACLDDGFQRLHLQHIIGRVMPGNAASVRVLEKIGMRYWERRQEKGQTWYIYRTSGPEQG